jgi:hypothetical protein
MHILEYRNIGILRAWPARHTARGIAELLDGRARDARSRARDAKGGEKWEVKLAAGHGQGSAGLTGRRPAQRQLSVRDYGAARILDGATIVPVEIWATRELMPSAATAQ